MHRASFVLSLPIIGGEFALLAVAATALTSTLETLSEAAFSRHQ
jgi:hypothetical protein